MLVKITHNDKCVKCRFFVVPADGPALLRISDNELLDIIRVICETIDNKTTSRKLDPQAKLDEDSIRMDKTNIPDYLNSITSKTNNMLDYLNCSNNKEADKSVSEAITKRIHTKFNDLFSVVSCFEGTFSLQVKEHSH